MELINSKTYKNLAKSYAGECQAMVRYKFIEYGARMNKYKNIAQIIDQLVYNEFNHARMFYTFLQEASDDTINNIDIASGYPFKEKWDLQENLRLAAEDELDEATKIYAKYRDTAKEEGFTEIAELYDNIIEVEKRHHSILTQLYTQMKDGTLYKKDIEVVWKCADCGYEARGKKAWTKCPLCKAGQGSIMLHIKEIN